MKRYFLIVILLALVVGVRAQGKPPQIARTEDEAEVLKLHDDYIKATKDYKVSLEKLLPLYEKDQNSAEQRFAQSRELFTQGLISIRERNDSEHSVAEAKAKVIEVHKQIETADEQIANLPTTAELLRQHRKDMREYAQSLPKQRRSICRNWRIEAYHRETPSTVTTAFKFVCEKK